MPLSDLLKIGPHITALPVIHGSGDFALEVRRVMLDQTFDVVAVPLPPSFQHDVEKAIERLPVPTVVVQREPPSYESEWTPDQDFDGETFEDNDDEDEDDDNEDDELDVPEAKPKVLTTVFLTLKSAA